MSPLLYDMLDALNMNRVPRVWIKLAYPSLKPLASWFDDLISKINFFNLWI